MKKHVAPKASRDLIWHPYTRHSAQRRGLPVIVRGKGPWLYDQTGTKYLDAISSWWCVNLGHGHPRLVRAIRRQAGQLQHSILGGLSHPPALTLAGMIANLFPTPGRRVLFASDGSSAVEAALKVAVQYWHNRGRPEKKQLVALRHAYHGDTTGAISVGFVPAFHTPFKPLCFPCHRAEAPCCQPCRHGKEPGTCALPCFESMRRLLKARGARVAAVIVEPLCLGSDGMRIYSPRYLAALAGLCRRENVLLIVDEIAMGMGRTGRMFAFEHAGIDPDIVCVGKGLSAGYLPISATVVKSAVFKAFDDRAADRTLYHGHTFTGNPIAAALAIETLKVYGDEDVVEGAASRGEFMREELEPLAPLPHVCAVRCLGMVGAVEFRGLRNKPSGSELAQRVKAALLEQHILIRPLGPVVYLMPPLNTPRRDLARLCRLFAAAVAKAQ
jgi:adenosylmethionine-8-amino-7-oxononanoate aminotransferase